MDKEITIKAIEDLITAHKLWSQANATIAQLGGDIYESPFGEALTYHMDTVYSMIVACRGAAVENDEDYRSCFWDAIWALSDGNYETIEIVNTEGEDMPPVYLNSATAIYEFFVRCD